MLYFEYTFADLELSILFEIFNLIFHAIVLFAIHTIIVILSLESIVFFVLFLGFFLCSLFFQVQFFFSRTVSIFLEPSISMTLCI